MKITLDDVKELGNILRERAEATTTWLSSRSDKDKARIELADSKISMWLSTNTKSLIDMLTAAVKNPPQASKSPDVKSEALAIVLDALAFKIKKDVPEDGDLRSVALHVNRDDASAFEAIAQRLRTLETENAELRAGGNASIDTLLQDPRLKAVMEKGKIFLPMIMAALIKKK